MAIMTSNGFSSVPSHQHLPSHQSHEMTRDSSGSSAEARLAPGGVTKSERAMSSTSSGDSRLAPGQSNKFGLACLRCRSRKVKCDGVRPHCANCTRKNFECTFDVEPKRRGPDKQPGRKRRTAAQKKADLASGHDPKAGGRPRAHSSASAAGLQRLSPESSASPTADPQTSYHRHPASAPPKRRKSEIVKSERADEQDAFAHPHQPNRAHHHGHPNGNGSSSGHASTIQSAPERGQISPVSAGSSSGTSSSAFSQNGYQNFVGHPHHAPVPHPYDNNGYGLPHHPNQLHHLPFPNPGYAQPPHHSSDPPLSGLPHHAPHLPHGHYHQQQPPQHHPIYRHPDPHQQHPSQNYGFHGQPPPETFQLFPANGHHHPGPSSQLFPAPHQTFHHPQDHRGIATPQRPPYPLVDAQSNGHGNGRVADPYAHPGQGSSRPDSSKGKRRATDADLDSHHHSQGLVGQAMDPRTRADENVREGEAHRPWAENGSVDMQRPGSGVSTMSFKGLDLTGKPASPVQLSRVASRPSTGNSRDSSGSSAMIKTPSAHHLQLHQRQNNPSSPSFPKAPSAEYPRQMWFDVLLSQFGRNRDVAYGTVVSSLTHLFKVSNHWLAFINIPLFIAKLHHPQHRQNLQPSLVYAMLALGSHMTSWEGPGGRGFEGRLLGLQFKEQALAAFWSSWNSGWIDAGLAKAAFLMALYEASGNPLQSDARSASAMLLLDNVMRTLALPALDVSEPTCNMYPQNEVPDVKAVNVSPMIAYSSLGLHSEQSTSNCPFWAACPRWSNPNDPSSVSEIEKDETRRMVWASSALAASFSMYRYSIGLEYVELYIGNPENFALLYPGENVLVGSGHDGKSSVWALYAATGMLWHFALRMHLSDCPEEEKQAHAVKVWSVSRNIERMFDEAKSAVAADLDMVWYERLGALAYDWQSRDWLLSSRMLVSDSFSRFIPDPADAGNASGSHLASARSWLAAQSNIAQCLHPTHPASKIKLQGSEGLLLVNHRPVWIFWLIQQLSRALQLYDINPSLLEALVVIREDFVPLLQHLLNLYPSEGLFDTLSALTARVNHANHRAGEREVVFHFPAILGGEEVQSLMARRPLGTRAMVTELAQ